MVETNRVTLRNKTTGWYAGVQAHSSKTARLVQVLQTQQLNPLLEKMLPPHHGHSVINHPLRAGRVSDWVCMAGPEASCSVGALNFSCFVLTHLQTLIHPKIVTQS